MSRGQPHPTPVRDDTGRRLVTRQVAAFLAHRHVNLVRREIAPVACNVATRAALLDLDEVEDHFAHRPHRNPAALRPIDPAGPYDLTLAPPPAPRDPLRELVETAATLGVELLPSDRARWGLRQLVRQLVEDGLPVAVLVEDVQAAIAAATAVRE